MSEFGPTLNEDGVNNNDIKIEKSLSTRDYKISYVIEKDIRNNGIIFKEKITPNAKILLIGDGQGADTNQFLEMGVKPENIESINYKQEEVDKANNNLLAGSGVKMKQGDATNMESLLQAGVKKESQDVVVMMHVLEVHHIRNKVEKQLIENIYDILKPGGEALISQYTRKLTSNEAKELDVQEITENSQIDDFGPDWKEKFKNKYNIEWREGMRYSEISNIRSKEELLKLFSDRFEIRLEQNSKEEYIIRLKKK